MHPNILLYPFECRFVSMPMRIINGYYLYFINFEIIMLFMNT